MNTLNHQSTLGPSILGVIRRFLPLIAALAIVFALLGIGLPLLAPDNFVATATLVVEDPSAATLFDSLAPDGSSDLQRYVNDQAAILSSTPIIEQALLSITVVNPEVPDSIEAMLEQMNIVVDDSSNVINIQYSSGDAGFSVVAVNAVLNTYEDFVELRRSTAYTDAISELNDSIAAANTEIDQIQDEVNRLLRGSETRNELDFQFQQIIDRLAVLQRGSTQSAERTAEIVDLTVRLEALQAVNAVESDLPDLRPLVDRRTEAIQRESELLSRRDQLTADAQLQQSGVALVAPAVSAESVGRNPVLTGMAGLVLGLVLGSAAAYWIGQSQRRFEHRMQPQEILGTPLLGDIPRLLPISEIPVIDQPNSASAHAFRALAGVLQQSIPSLRVTAESIVQAVPTPNRGAVIAFLSAGEHPARTLITLNTAVAAARSGLRVLMIDGDLDAQRSGSSALAERIQEIDSEVPEPVVLKLPIDDRFEIDVMGWGLTDRFVEGPKDPKMFRDPIPDSDVLSTSMFRDRILQASERYDLTLLDLPGILRSAPSADVVRLVDSVVTVVGHHSLVARADEVRHRLNLIGANSIGYVYTHSTETGVAQTGGRWRSELTATVAIHLTGESDSVDG